MLIDKLKRRHPFASFREAPKHQLKNAITFFIDETGDDLYKRYIESTQPAVTACLPYQNFFLQTKEGGVWIVDGGEDKIFLTSFHSKGEKMMRYNGNLVGGHPMATDVLEVDNKENLQDNMLSVCVASEYRDKYPRLNDYLKGFLGIVLISFLNILSCKNIRTKKIQGNKKRKRAKTPLFSYYILQIETKTKGGCGKPQDLWSNRVHLCRGHIKTYLKERPLFGKYVGNVWCPPHARGSKIEGVIHKDYAI